MATLAAGATLAIARKRSVITRIQLGSNLRAIPWIDPPQGDREGRPYVFPVGRTWIIFLNTNAAHLPAAVGGPE